MGVTQKRDRLNNAKTDNYREFLVCLGVATVSAGIGFYLQQRFKWKIPGINKR